MKPKTETESLLEASKKAVRVLSHIQDMGIADPLKHVPVSAYKEVYKELKQAIRNMEKRRK